MPRTLDAGALQVSRAEYLVCMSEHTGLCHLLACYITSRWINHTEGCSWSFRLVHILGNIGMPHPHLRENPIPFRCSVFWPLTIFMIFGDQTLLESGQRMTSHRVDSPALWTAKTQRVIPLHSLHKDQPEAINSKSSCTFLVLFDPEVRLSDNLPNHSSHRWQRHHGWQLTLVRWSWQTKSPWDGISKSIIKTSGSLTTTFYLLHRW